MIAYPPKNKKELSELIEMEQKLYCPKESYKKHIFRHSKAYALFRALKAFRVHEYYALNHRGSSIVRLFLERRCNLLCEKVGLELTAGKVAPGIKLYHSQIVLNGYVGENCIFHGNNMIGNKRTGARDEVPHIGNNVDVGYGAVIIGNVTIADHCVIGAGAVVTKSFEAPGSIIAGVPARLVTKNE